MFDDTMRVVRTIDYHCHTYHSPCAQAEMVAEKIVRTAEERGIEILGVTDHWYRHLLHLNSFQKVRKEFAGIKTPVRILFSCEAEVISPTEISITEEEAKRFDYVMMSATHIQNIGIVSQPPGREPDVVAQFYLALFRRAVETPFADIVPHPFYIVPNTYDPLTLDYLKDNELLEAIEIARENKVAMEISRRALDPVQNRNFLRFYQLCKKVGLKFSIGSDAHWLKELGLNVAVEPIIRELDLKVSDLWKPRENG